MLEQYQKINTSTAKAIERAYKAGKRSYTTKKKDVYNIIGVEVWKVSKENPIIRNKVGRITE